MGMPMGFRDEFELAAFIHYNARIVDCSRGVLAY
jgi:hypothetical protein